MYVFFSSQQFGRKFVIISPQKRKKKGVCGVLKLDFFSYHLIVITHLLSWVLPRPENDYAGFFFPSLQGSTEAPFSHLDKAALFYFSKGSLIEILSLCTISNQDYDGSKWYLDMKTSSLAPKTEAEMDSSTDYERDTQ